MPFEHNARKPVYSKDPSCMAMELVVMAFLPWVFPLGSHRKDLEV